MNEDKSLDNPGNGFLFISDYFWFSMCEITNFLTWNCKNVHILIQLTQYRATFFAWIRWHVIKMRLSSTALCILNRKAIS